MTTFIPAPRLVRQSEHSPEHIGASPVYRKQLALFEPTLVVQALKEAVKKLNPQAQWRNPVISDN
ncbi:hypothetical protein F6P93_12660 [Escherichia coli]|nr:hypothetical protein F6P93_12660 [Escherichia coli]